jgi:DNA-binding transcriptional MerR regulator
MPYKEKETSRLYYTIGEVAKMFHVNASLIRFWEKEFDIIKPQKNKKGNRLFTQEDVDNFHVIFHLVKENGYTLQGANEKLKTGTARILQQAELVQSLNKVKQFLLELKDEI